MSRPDVRALLDAFRAELAAADDPATLDEVRRTHTGKKSPLKLALRGLRDVPDAERPLVAKEINEAREAIEAELDAAAEGIEAKALEQQVAAEWQDLSMPGIAPARGARHPLIEVQDQIMAVLRQLGFQLVEGPEVEHPFYNFDALNIPEHHPARDMQDTFWVDGGYLLRSHTTTVQARVLEQASTVVTGGMAAGNGAASLPIKVASAGRVYRNEAVDATHTAMFHQLEGIWIDRGLTFAHLKGVLAFIARSLYGEHAIRFKPKFYPYTEPSIGVDLACSTCKGAGTVDGEPCEACHAAGWVTILGAGMIHPNVFTQFGFDPREVSGIAFGLGTTRMAGQKVGVTKIKSLYEQDLRVLQRLHRGSE